MTAKDRRNQDHGLIMTAIANGLGRIADARDAAGNALGKFQDACAAALAPMDFNPTRGELDSFQHRTVDWLTECFGPLKPSRRQVRTHRFLEEALEFAQALEMPKEEALALVSYVYSRPRGEPSQEAGGVMVTMAGACAAQGIDMHEAAEVELDRCWQNTAAIKEKNANKPDFTVAAPPPVEPVPLTRERAFELYATAARAAVAFFAVKREQGDAERLEHYMAILGSIVAELRGEFADDIAAATDAVPVPDGCEDRTWFWRVVDQQGFAHLPSDEVAALSLILEAYKSHESTTPQLAVANTLALALYEGGYKVAMAHRAAVAGQGFKSRVEKAIDRDLEPALSAFYEHNKPAELPAAA